MIEKAIMINNTDNYRCIFCSIINGTSEGITVYYNNHFLVNQRSVDPVAESLAALTALLQALRPL